MSDAPFVEKLVEPAADTEASKGVRTRLTAVLAELNPVGGKTDAGGEKGEKPRKKKKKKQQ
ncbi:MAG: hypothetical protein NTY98_07950 [Verrucomicrobia bacterium]|nr:hypothetical protein [Verrucomicrobiota bacterium]